MKQTTKPSSFNPSNWYPPNLPPEQLTLWQKCTHPDGQWHYFAPDEIQQSIPQLFAKIVSQYPHRFALKSPRAALSYSELDTLSDGVAQQLLTQLGEKPQPVVLCCQQDVAAIVALLGVLKAGKFFVCLDPENPMAVNQQLITEIEPACILADLETLALARELTASDLPLLQIQLSTQPLPQMLSSLPSIAPSALAYITFTSGSSGRAKGVMEDHQDVLHYTSLFTNYFHLCPEDRILALTRISTGGAWVSIFPGLLNGSCIYLFDVRNEGSTRLAQWLVEQKITVMTMAVTIFRELAPELPPKAQLTSLRMLGLGGESIRADDIQLYRERCSDQTILRFAFGATEAHFISCYFMDKTSPLPTGPTPTGYASGDAEIVLLDPEGNEVAVGEIGELVVKRRYLTPGYWRNPQLTAARYRTDPQDPTQRWYFFGDLAYKQADGCLVHRGRADNQVKIRGHFVDVDALETQLVALDEVEQAAVKVRQSTDGTSYLIAYLQVNPSKHATTTALYERLVTCLPAHLLPRSLVLLDQMPKTLSGKIDRNALPEPNVGRPALTTPYIPAKSLLEQRLVEMWQELLTVQPIGTQDHFLELGGDSLRAMMLINRLSVQSDEMVYVRMLFDAPTVAAFAHFLTLHYPTLVQKLTNSQAKIPKSPSLLPTQQPKLDPLFVEQVRSWLTTFRRPSNPSLPKAVNKNPAAVFILSPPRSGSTLLRVLLAGHPQLFAPPELQLLFFNTLQEWQRTIALPGVGEIESTLRAIMAARNCDSVAAQHTLAQLVAENLSTQQFYRQLQTWIAPRLLVDKTPGYAYAQETLCAIEEEFAEARYIHLVRHPCGMIRSYVEYRSALLLFARLRHKSLSDSAPAHLDDLSIASELLAEAIWLIAQQNISAFLATIPAERQMRVYFEDLLENPELVSGRICEFLKIPFDPAILDPYGDPTVRMTDGINALNQVTGDSKFGRHHRIDPTVADRWRELYSERMLSEASWRVAQQLGYAMPRYLDPTHKPEEVRQMEQLLVDVEALSEEEVRQLSL